MTTNSQLSQPNLKNKTKREPEIVRGKSQLKTTRKKRENQDGGIGRHTVSPRTTRTDRKSNGKEVQHQENKK